MEKQKPKCLKAIRKEVMGRKQKAKDVLARAKELTRKGEVAMKNGKQRTALRAIQLAGKLALLATKIRKEGKKNEKENFIGGKFDGALWDW